MSNISQEVVNLFTNFNQCFIFRKIIAKERTTECAHTFVQHLIKKYNEMESVNYAFSDTGSDIEDEIPHNNGDDVELESDNTSILVYK